MIILFVILLVIVAGISEAVGDTLLFHYDTSIFNSPEFKKEFWNIEISWKNKGSNIIKRTLLVFITDAWHLFKVLHTVFLFLMVITIFTLTTNVYLFALYLAIAYTLKKGVFELFWSKVLIKK